MACAWDLIDLSDSPAEGSAATFSSRSPPPAGPTSLEGYSLSPELRVFDPLAPAPGAAAVAAHLEVPACAALGLATLSLEGEGEVAPPADAPRLPMAAVASRVPLAPALVAPAAASGSRAEDGKQPEVLIPTDLYDRFLEAGRLARLRGQHKKTIPYGRARIVRSEP